VITGDLDTALAEAIRAVSTGTTSTRTTSTGAGTGAGDSPSTAGTWRPAPPGTSGGPGSYATTIAFLLAQHPAKLPGHAPDPQARASELAARLRARPEISQATATSGYLTVTVTADTLAALAVRITEAGPACACGSALRGVTLAAPRGVDLAAARTWDEAYQRLAGEVTGRLAAAAGAQVQWEDPAQRLPGTDSTSAGSSPVADSINFAGVDAIRYALCRVRGTGTGPRRTGPRRLRGEDAVDARAAAGQHLGNPAYAVWYAHAHAASALRQAADLGLDKGNAADAQLRLLAHPGERALLDAMSWLPERVGGAARRGRPDVLTGYLEDLAAAYFDCQEGCPAVPPGLPDEPPGRPVTTARLWLSAAAGTALGAGLGLLGVAAPDRL
jgi:arginyl-tRNA synthetase